MRFLDGPAAEAAIKELLSTAERARIAVAYWGDGAVERLGINNMVIRDVQVVCDLLSGACNPGEIEHLRKVFDKDRVMTCDRLHAKVWLTDKGAIIGSSNASANGLGYEGDEAAGLIEANILVDDRPTLDAIQYWFERRVFPDVRKITDADLKCARIRWKKHRVGRPVPEGKSVLEKLIKDPAAFSDRNFSVWVEHLPNLDDWADKMLQAAQKERHNNRISCWQFDVEERVPLPGEYILHFEVGKSGKAKIEEFAQVLNDDPVKQRAGKGRIVLTKPVKYYRNLPLGDQKAWADAAGRAVARTDTRKWEGDIERFGRDFLSARA